MSNYKVINSVKDGGWIVIEALHGLMGKKVSGPFIDQNQAEARKEDLIKCEQGTKQVAKCRMVPSGQKNITKDNVVIPIKPSVDAAQALRNIADQIDNGDLPNEATVVCGPEVFHAGQIDDGRAAADAVFNLNLGIHKLMNGALRGDK